VTRVNLITFDNGFGNTRDIGLLSEALRAAGCTVVVTLANKHERRRRRLRLVRRFGATRLWLSRRRQARGQHPEFDVCVMVEHVWPERLHLARRNVIVPHPEFFDRHDRSLLDRFDCVWAKTRNTFDIFTRLGCRASLTGSDSDDRHLDGVEREATFFHLAGGSRMKGTARLTALWSRHPEWPRLTVVQNAARTGAAVPAANIEYQTRYLTDAELRLMQNRNAFHVCTSETEGWGHYIVEAQSTGAVVLATDAPPMNELVTTGRGLLIRGTAVGHQHLATTYQFDAADFERVVERALGMDAAARARLGAAARDWFWENKRGFPARLAAALGALEHG